MKGYIFKLFLIRVNMGEILVIKTANTRVKRK